MYNPQDQTPPPDFSDVQTQFRLLDQSITIASLYQNGRRSYEPYLHLHKPEDLNESDLQYQQDIFCSLPFSSIPHEEGDEIMNSPTLSKPGSTSNFDNNIIHENFDITNMLLNDKHSIDRHNPPTSPHTQIIHPQAQSGEVATIYDNEDHRDTIPDLSYSLDAQAFVNLIEREKYYWILDLFNELNIWKSVIPTYCLESDGGKDLFLIDCLLNCSTNSKIDLNILLQQQLSLWYKARTTRLVHSDNISKFENLLISISLILLSVFRNIQKENCTTYMKIILNNQVKIFNKVIAKLKDFLRSKNTTSIILTSAIQSIVMLKFFLIKKFELESKIVNTRQLVLNSLLDLQEDNQLQEFDGSEDIQEQIDYPLLRDKDDYMVEQDLSALVHLTSFEISNLNRSFKKYDFAQISYLTQLGNLRHDFTSDAHKLREYLWYVIKLNYVIHHPDNKLIEIDYNFIFQSRNVILPNMRPSRGPSSISNLSELLDDGNGTQSGSSRAMSKYRVVLPNDRGVAINLLREYIRKQINLGSTEVIQEANQKIYTIFKLIEESVVEKEIKSMWKSSFIWVLQQVMEPSNKPQEQS